MEIRSLGYRTDLALLSASGSEVEDRGTHLVVRTPDNPTYFWGNFLLLRDLPVPGGEREVVGAFRTEFPEAEHVALGLDATTAYDEEALRPFVDAGLSVDVCTVLTTDAVSEPRPPEVDPEVDAEVRPLEGDDDWEARARLSRVLHPSVDEDTFLTFARRKNGQERALVAAGAGRRYGAFVGGALVATAGAFRAGDGVARFQSVETHPDHRRRGLGSAVVHASARHALDDLGVTTLVIVADPDAEAIRIYRGLGFSDSERQTQLFRAPDDWPDAG